MSNGSGVARSPAIIHPLAHQMQERDRAEPDRFGTRAQRRAWKKKYGKKVEDQ